MKSLIRFPPEPAIYKKQGRIDIIPIGTIAICDSEDAVTFLIEEQSGRHRVDAWLALTPPAALALSERGIPHLIVDYHFNDAEILGDFDARLDSMVTWALWVDQYLQAVIPEFAQFNYSPCITFFYRIINFFDRFNIHRWSLQSFLSRHQPEKILWASGFESILDKTPVLGGHFVDMILPALAKERDISLEIFTVPSNGPSAPFAANNFLKKPLRYLKEKGRLLRKIARRPGFLSAARRLSEKSRDNVWSHQLPEKTAVLVLGDGYDIQYVLPELAGAGVKLFYPPLKKLTAQAQKINIEDIRTRLKDAWNNVLAEPKFWTILEGWDPGREIVKPWLSHLWNHSFPACWQAILKSTEYLSTKKEKYQALILPNAQALDPYETGIGFLHAARKAGIPVFSFTHGNLPGYCHQPLQVLWDMPHADYVFAYGPGVATYLNQVAQRYPFRKATAISGGSPRIDAIRQSYDTARAAATRQKLAGSDPRPLILYIPNFLIYHRRFTGDASACMPYFELQQQLIELFAELRDIRLVYRYFISDWPDLIHDLLKSRVEDVIIASFRNYYLSDLMWSVDGIIVDYPATPLAEVLLTKKPIAVYCDKRYYKITEEAKTLLTKRVELAESPGEYLKIIRKFLTLNNFDDGPKDNSFYKYYISDKDNGHAAKHVAEFILKEIAKPANGS